MNNFKLVIQYAGTKYHGFARQENLVTVQGVIEETLSQILKEKIEIVGSGRTDKNVHAIGQVISFKTDKDITCYGLKSVLNSRLPEDIRVKNVEKVADDFHARYSAKTKTYLYVINNKEKCAFTKDFECYCRYKLDVEKMKKALVLFLGKHDFKSYMSTGSNKRNTVRTITDVKLYEKNDRIFIEITGDGFLYNQVRIMVATLIEIGRGKINEEIILKSFDIYVRELLGKTADPRGLYLKEVNY